MALRDRQRSLRAFVAGWALCVAVLAAGNAEARSRSATTGQPSPHETTTKPEPAPEPPPPPKAEPPPPTAKQLEAESKAAAATEQLRDMGRPYSVEIQMRWLGDQLAEDVKIKTRSGGGRYDRWAVLPFAELGTDVETKQLGLLSATRLEAALTADHSFICVDREKLMEVAREKQLSRVILYEEAKIRQAGRAVNADVLVMGSVGIVGGRYVVNARAANVETGQVLSSARVEIDARAFNSASVSAVQRTRLLSGLRSAVVPGWGQLHNKQYVKSALFFAVAGTLLGVGIKYTVSGYNQEKKYLAISADKPGACEAFVSNANDFNGCLHAQRSLGIQNYQRANIFYGAFLGVYALGIIDAYIYGENSTRSLGSSVFDPRARASRWPSLSFGPQGFTLNGSF